MPTTYFTTTSEPAVEPVTTADAKTFMRVSTSDDDTLIGGLITTARKYFEEVYNRALITQTLTLYMDEFPGDENDVIELPRPPAASITTVKYYDTAGTLQTLSASYYTLSKTEPARLMPAYNCYWPQTRDIPDAVQIAYVAGYGSSSTNVPAGIIVGLKQLIQFLYDHRDKVVDGSITTVPRVIDALFWQYSVKGVS